MPPPVTSSSAGSTTTSSGTSIPAVTFTSANPKPNKNQRKNKNRKEVVKAAKKTVEAAAEEAAKKALSGVTGTASTAPLPAPGTPSGNRGGLGAAVTESTPSASETASALGGMTRKDSEYVFHYDDAFLEWTPKGAKRPIRYAVALDIPLKKPRSQYTPNELALAAKEFADIWIADVTARLHADGCPLTPGQEIKALFEGKDGYLLFHPKDGLDPKALSTKEITERTATVKADSDEAKALSTLVDSCKPETFREQLTQPVYNTLRRDATTKTDKAGDNYPPSNLVNTGNSCFVNSPFLNLVRNRGITQELRNPENFRGGAQNPLYKAIKGYLDHQASGSKEPYSLGELAAELGIDDTRQDDVDYVWHMFDEQLDYSKMNPDSPLRSLFVDKLTIAPKAGVSAQALMQKAIGVRTGLHKDSAWGKGQPPKTFTVYVGGRSDFTVKPVSALTDPQKAQIVDDLIAHKDAKETELDKLKDAFEDDADKDLCDDLTANTRELETKVDALKDPELKQLFNKLVFLALLENITNLETITSSSSAADKLTLANTLLADDKIFWDEYITRILTPSERSRIGRERCPAATKVTTAIVNPVSVKITSGGKTTAYELMSFSSHRGSTGASGHYTTFERRGDQYWEIDDQKGTSTPSDKTAFLEAAKTAAFCVYGTVGMSGGPEAAAKPVGNEEIEQAEGIIGQAKVVVEAGKLKSAGEGFALVNPTDSALDRVNDEFKDNETTLKADLQAERSKIFERRAAFYKVKKWRSDKINGKAGKATELHHSIDGKSLQVLHVSVGDWGKFDVTSPEGRGKIDEAIASMVNGALEKAEKGGIARVAFPLIDILNYSPEQAYEAMRKAINDFLAGKVSRAHPILEVKIVVTEDQKKRIPALNTAVDIAEAAAVAEMEIPEYQVGTHTTLVVDSTGVRLADLGPVPAVRPQTLAQAIQADLATLTDDQEVTFDLTLGDGAPMNQLRRPFTFNIAHFGVTRYFEAVATFQAELERFAGTNTGASAKKVKIKLKIPQGITAAVKRYPLVGSSPAPTATTAAPPPAPAQAPITAKDVVKAAQDQFLAGLSGIPQTGIPVTFTTSNSNTTITPIAASKAIISTTSFIKHTDESMLMGFLAAANRDANQDEIIVDCRPGCKQQDGIVALDVRHFHDTDRKEQLQRVRNFIQGFIESTTVTKPLRIIFPSGPEPFPEPTKRLISTYEAWMPRATPRISSFG